MQLRTRTKTLIFGGLMGLSAIVNGCTDRLTFDSNIKVDGLPARVVHMPGTAYDRAKFVQVSDTTKGYESDCVTCWAQDKSARTPIYNCSKSIRNPNSPLHKFYDVERMNNIFNQEYAR